MEGRGRFPLTAVFSWMVLQRWIPGKRWLTLFNVAVFTLGVLSRYVSAVRHCHGRLAVDSDFGRLLCRSSILGDGEML